MRVLLLGGTGILGTALREAGEGLATPLVAPTRAELDVTDADALARAVDAAAPDWILNCVAYTAVDAAESDAAGAMRLNAELPARLAALCATRPTRLVHVSTDYVFGGSGAGTDNATGSPTGAGRGTGVGVRPWREDDPCAPQSVYGRSKRAGEEAVLASGAAAAIVRTAWLYGMTGKSFAGTMWARATQRQPSRVVDDQHGAPTFAPDLAQWILALVQADARGVFHAANAGATTWAEVAERIYARAGFAGGVTRVSSAEFAAPAQRPAYSVLDCTRLDAVLAGVGQGADGPDTRGRVARRSWQDALDDYLGRVSPSAPATGHAPAPPASYRPA